MRDLICETMRFLRVFLVFSQKIKIVISVRSHVFANLFLDGFRKLWFYIQRRLVKVSACFAYGAAAQIINICRAVRTYRSFEIISAMIR